MKTTMILSILFLFFGGSVAAKAAHPVSGGTVAIPLTFVENRGQVRQEILYYAKTPSYRVGATKRGLCFGDGAMVRFVDANPRVIIEPVGQSVSKANFFSGNDPTRWRTGVDAYPAILYRGIYDGIDLKVYGNGRDIEYDWIVKPNADPTQIRLCFQNVKEAKLDSEGNLQIETASNRFFHRRPVAYQMIKNKKIKIEATFKKLERNLFCFSLGEYDPEHELIIDPLITQFATYLGGAGEEDMCFGETVDRDGFVYLCGRTDSLDFPLSGAIQDSKSRADDCFVCKLDPAEGKLLFSTYLGGHGDERAYRVAVGPDNSIYVVGVTYSGDFPVVDPLQGDHHGNGDAFVCRLSANGGRLIYSTFLGGSGYDAAKGVAVDGNGDIYLTGVAAENFPLNGPVMGFQGAGDVFAVKLAADGQSLIYSTCIGGGSYDSGTQICVEEDGSAVLVGITDSPGFPVVDGWQARHGGGRDTCIVKLNPEGGDIMFSTFIGGDRDDECYAIERDSSGFYYLAGSTRSGNFPIKDAWQSRIAGAVDAFLLGVDLTKKLPLFSTYLGGTGDDYARDLAVGSRGGIYVAGQTYSWNFPLKEADQEDKRSKYDFFIAKFNARPFNLVSSTYFGGRGNEVMGFSGVSLDGYGDIYVAGSTSSESLQTKRAIKVKNSGGYDVYVAKFKEDHSRWVRILNVEPHQVVTGFVEILLERKTDLRLDFVYCYIDGEWTQDMRGSGDKYFWNSCGVGNGLHWITAKLENKEGLVRYDTVPVLVNNVIVTLSGTRKTDRIWLKKIALGVIEFAVKKIRSPMIDRYCVFKWTGSGKVEKIADIPETNPERTTQTFKYTDMKLDPGKPAIYFIRAFSEDGNIIGISNRMEL